MEKKLDTLMIVSYDDDIIEHRQFKRSLLKDDDFKKYFGEMFINKQDEFFSASESIETKKVYLVKDEDKIVGMIRIYSYHESGVANIQYAVSPDCRKQGYGLRILKEITNFLLENNIHCIEGDIDKNNIGSINIATTLGYKDENNKYRMRG